MSQDIKILIVDDDPAVLWATSKVVKSGGYGIYQADSGAACMALAKKNRPALILLDIELPDINGDEICRQIKSDPILKNTFVVLISGAKTSSEDQADGLDTGADGYIARPISNRELLSRINAIVRIIHAEREKDRLIFELQRALSKIKKLSGLIPICAFCKKIRDDEGYWNELEAYLHDHSEAELSHSLCPDCAKKYYPDYDIDDH